MLHLPMPVGDYEWVEDVEAWNFKEIDPEGTHSYFMDVDISYPEELFHQHRDYPLCPETSDLDFNFLSPFNRRLYRKSHPAESEKKSYKARKLMATFNPRTHYVSHLRNILFYIEQGMVVTKVHRACKFKQSAYLKEYISLVTKLRAESKSAFAIRLFKLFANALYGKTIENVLLYTEVSLCQTRKALQNRVLGSVDLVNVQVINENLTAVIRKPKKVTMSKLYAVGASILECSKWFMYDVHYNVFKKYWGSGLTLIYSDTDSFFYKIKTNNLLLDLTNLKHHFDFSNYDAVHRLFDGSNRNQVFKFKDECKGRTAIVHFVALRPKVYCFKSQSLIESNEEISVKKVCKGLKASSIQNGLCFEDYLQTLHQTVPIYRSFYNFRSKKHQITTVLQRKKALDAMDTKRWIYDCGIHTDPHGFTHSGTCPFC